jgi:hypothetical protein
MVRRSPIAINTNPFFVLEDDPTPSRTSQIARCGSANPLSYLLLLFIHPYFAEYVTSLVSPRLEPAMLILHACGRATSLVWSALSFCKAVRDKTLQPDM